MQLPLELADCSSANQLIKPRMDCSLIIRILNYSFQDYLNNPTFSEPVGTILLVSGYCNGVPCQHFQGQSTEDLSGINVIEILNLSPKMNFSLGIFNGMTQF